jgi:hypothetical protein
MSLVTFIFSLPRDELSGPSISGDAILPPKKGKTEEVKTEFDCEAFSDEESNDDSPFVTPFLQPEIISSKDNLLKLEIDENL